MDEVADRHVDDKYTISYEEMMNILENISSEYFCLEIDGKKVFYLQTDV